MGMPVTTEDALLAAVLAAPGDDLPRKAIADYWRENGQPEWADFVEVQLELAKTPQHHRPNGWCDCVRCRLLTVEKTLWDAGVPPLPDDFGTPVSRHHLSLGYDGIVDSCRWSVRHWAVGLSHRRGFLDEIRCTLADWCGGVFGIGPQVVRKHPVTKVVLTDVEPDRIPGTDPEGDARVWGHHTIDRFPEQVRRFVWPHGLQFWHGTREMAVNWLSQALISWAKSVNTTTANINAYGDGLRNAAYTIGVPAELIGDLRP